ncbi:MAG: M61 family metallopeptidase, partial [Sphingobacterium sp.]
MSDSSIHFRISFIEPQAHYFEVEITIKNFDQEFIDLKMPVWSPGSYLIREYARHVESLTARNENELTESKKIN